MAKSKPRYASMEQVREALQRTGIKNWKIAEWAGKSPDTITSALRDGTSNVDILEAVARALSVEHATEGELPVRLGELACMRRSRQDTPAENGTAAREGEQDG